MRLHSFRKLKHSHPLHSERLLHVPVANDLPPVLGVLEIVGLDVLPDALDGLRTGDGGVASDEGGECGSYEVLLIKERREVKQPERGNG